MYRELCALLRVQTPEPMVALLRVDIASSFVADSSGVPTPALECTRWMASEYRRPYDMTGVKQIENCFCAHAAQLRKTPTDRR